MADSWKTHVRAHGPLRPLAGDLWQVTGVGPPLDRNMVVWRRPTGGLWLHSVVALDDDGLRALDALGPVEAIVVPNPLHRMDCGIYAQRYPRARVLAPAAARDAAAKRVRLDATCEETAAELGLTVHVPRGTRLAELAYELPVVGGRALVLADLLFNIVEPPAGVQGLVLRYVTSSIGPLHISRIFRWFYLVDRAEYADWVDGLATIPDLRVLAVGHGPAVEGAVAAALRQAAGRIRGEARAG